MNIFPQIAQITQRNAASCIISQRKTGLGGFGVSVVLGFICDYQRDLREIYWGSLCNNLSSLM